MRRAKQLVGLTCITASAATMTAAAIIGAHNAAIAVNEHLDTLSSVLGGGV